MVTRYETEKKTVADGAEELPLELGLPEGRKRTVTGLYCECTDLLYVRAYLNQDRLVDVNTAQIAFFYNASGWMVYVKLHVELKKSDVFKAGYYNNSGGSLANMEICVQYEEG